MIKCYLKDLIFSIGKNKLITINIFKDNRKIISINGSFQWIKSDGSITYGDPWHELINIKNIYGLMEYKPKYQYGTNWINFYIIHHIINIYL